MFHNGVCSNMDPGLNWRANVSANESERGGSRCREGKGSSFEFKAIAWRVLRALSYLDGMIIVSCPNSHFSGFLEVDIAVLFLRPSNHLMYCDVVGDAEKLSPPGADTKYAKSECGTPYCD